MGSKLNALMTNMSLKQTLIEPAFIDFFSQPLCSTTAVITTLTYYYPIKLISMY